MKVINVLIVVVLLSFFSDLFAVDWSGQSTSVVDHGANGGDSIDDTTAFANAINYCLSNGCKTLYIPNGTYYITSPLPQLNNSFSFVNLVGENASKTILNATGMNGNASVLNTFGGSGAIVNAEIKRLSLVGNDDHVGITIKGTCGVNVDLCVFTGFDKAIVFSNDVSQGTFTEFSIADRCTFVENKTILLFEKGMGDSSFHGSGIRRSTVSCKSGSTAPVIQIGGAVSSLINLYNSPIDMQIWTREDVDIIRANVDQGSKIITHGVITLELFDNSSPILANSAVPVYHAGNVTAWSSPIRFGDMQLVDWAVTNPDGTVNCQRKSYNIQKVINTASATIGDLRVTKLGSLVSVSLVASNYDYNYLLYLVHNGYGGNGYVSIIANPRSFNQAGLGDPVFTVDSAGRLVVLNKNYVGKEVSFKAFVFANAQNDPNFLGN